MAKPGRQIQSALMREPTARALPASTFRKTVAPPPRNVAPPPRQPVQQQPYQRTSPIDIIGRTSPADIIGGPAQMAGRVDNQVGIGQFEQNQFNRQIPQALPPPSLGIGSFMQNQFQPLPVAQPMTMPYAQQYQSAIPNNQAMMPAQQLPSPAASAAGGMLGGSIMGTAPQSQAMNQAAQIAQGGMAGMGPAFRR